MSRIVGAMLGPLRFVLQLAPASERLVVGRKVRDETGAVPRDGIARVCGIAAFFGNKRAKIFKKDVTTKYRAGAGRQDRHSARCEHRPGEFRLAGLAAKRAQRPTQRHQGSGRFGCARHNVAERAVTPVKLVKAGEGGALGAILPQGMRAISPSTEARRAQ
jgi:hypothetical protein